MDENYARPPLIDVTLPPAIVLSYIHLTLVYFVTLATDFFLLKNTKRRVPLGFLITVVHVALPLIFTTHNRMVNLFFAGIPWSIACFTFNMPLEQLTFHEWAKNVFKITLDPSSKEIPAHNSRYRGAALVFLGFLKFSFMNLLVEPFLPSKTVFGLYYSWFHPMSLIYTLLYGLKIYCTLGGMDIVLGIEQMITGWNMLELFDSPILATSPRDFWSVRWNRTVRNLLHSQVFSEGKRIEIQEEKKLGYELSEDEEQEVLVIVETSKSARKRAKEQQKNEEEQSKKQSGNHNRKKKEKKSGKQSEKQSERQWSSLFKKVYVRGLMTFLVSGIFHELLVMSACRKLTLENITFFLVQGVVVALEVALRQGALKQKPEGKTRVVCIAAQLTFMMITGRLFLGPFLRYGFI